MSVASSARPPLQASEIVTLERGLGMAGSAHILVYHGMARSGLEALNLCKDKLTF